MMPTIRFSSDMGSHFLAQAHQSPGQQQQHDDEDNHQEIHGLLRTRDWA